MNLNITGDEIDLNKEICRLETFKNNFIEDGELLAMYGIYCLDEEKFFLTNERLKCHFCSFSWKNYIHGDNVVVAHLKSSNCPLLNFEKTQNEFMDYSFFKMCLLQNSLNKINETGFHKEKLRAETFKNKIVHKSEILSMLGIYFDQNTERLKCHFCNFFSTISTNNDHVISLHLKSDCPLVNQKKTKNEFDNIFFFQLFLICFGNDNKPKKKNPGSHSQVSLFLDNYVKNEILTQKNRLKNATKEKSTLRRKLFDQKLNKFF